MPNISNNDTCPKAKAGLQFPIEGPLASAQ